MDAHIAHERASPERRLYVPRYNAFQRLNHWLTAIMFIALSLSGLSMFYPSLFWLSSIFGGGESARLLHPWFGVVLFVSFFVLALQFIARNIPNRDDVRWIRNIHRIARNEHEGLPDLGKYNAGQKGVYWSQFLLIPILFVTGIVIWQVYFGRLTTIPLQRMAVLIHAIAAVFAMTVIIVHIYAGIWIRGTGRAMLRGDVTAGWAYMHHRAWLRESFAKGLVRSRSGLHGDD